MNHSQKKRCLSISLMIILLTSASGLILYALKQNINLFLTPTELLSEQINMNKLVRLAGYVKKSSVHFDASGSSVEFIVTDRKNEITVHYHGILPNLFREGQVVVITGKLMAPQSLLKPKFEAEQVLAKHDERYRPRIPAGHRVAYVNPARWYIHVPPGIVRRLA